MHLELSEHLLLRIGCAVHLMRHFRDASAVGVGVDAPELLAQKMPLL